AAGLAPRGFRHRRRKLSAAIDKHIALHNLFNHTLHVWHERLRPIDECHASTGVAESERNLVPAQQWRSDRNIDGLARRFGLRNIKSPQPYHTGAHNGRTQVKQAMDKKMIVAKYRGDGEEQ